MDAEGDSIGSRVFTAREGLGWSRALLAEYAGTSPKTIEAIERGQVESPGSLLVGKIAAAMRLTPNDLIPPQEISELPRPGERLELVGRKIRRSGGKVAATRGARPASPSKLSELSGALLSTHLSAAA